MFNFLSDRRMTEDEEERALQALEGLSQGKSYCQLMREGVLKSLDEPPRWAKIDKSFAYSLKIAKEICADVMVNGVIDHVDQTEIAKRFKLASFYDRKTYGSDPVPEEREEKQTAEQIESKKQELLLEVQEILKRAKPKQMVIDG